MLDHLHESSFAARSNRELRVISAPRNPILGKIVTSHPEMSKMFAIMEKVADTSSTVLILGESGTGKELIARAIHEMGRSKGAFVPVNCGAIPDNLLESELFGYEKGAFTGAVASKPGRFVLAEGGTIFLDEIGEMSPHLQVKLLRVLQERVVEPVGGIKARAISVRVIAATHKNLHELVKKGLFREDLYYRLQVVPLRVPALAERATDIPMLADFFSRRASESIGRRPLTFSGDVQSLFLQYPWPGNVRELENLIERLSILVDNDVVTPSDLPEHMLYPHMESSDALPVSFPEEGLDFNQTVEQFENRLILQALERTAGNKKAAAKLLRLNRTTLVEKIKKKGLLGSDDMSDVDEGSL